MEDRKKRTVLVPNTSHAFCRIMSAALKTQGIRAVPLAVGREEAIRLGKQYVHNDICFPAQIVIGEALAALRSGQYVPSETAIGMGKYIGDCRLTHYSALLRKALNDAGYPEVAILTNDDVDYHDLHPGFRMNLMSAIRLAGALPMIDILEELLRKNRPYEKVSGSSDQAFDEALDFVVDGLERHGLSGALRGFKKAIQRMNAIEYDRSQPRPRVLIVGEYLLNFHPGANHEIERYLEKNGFEIIEARMTDVIRKTYFCQDEQIRTYHLKKPFVKKNWYHVANRVFDAAHAAADRIAKQHPLYTPVCRLPELVKESDPIIPHTFDAGEGVLIPGEILHHAAHGCRAFVILQPFGCLPNHVVGRGIVKKMREMYPDAQILPLDYDPDVSFANLENRLQMLIMNVKERSVGTVALPDVATASSTPRPPNRSRAPSPSAGSACVRGPRSCACTMCRRPSIRSGSSTHTNGTANNHRNRMIKVTDIHKRFGDLEVLKGVSLDVAEGEVVSIVGASGAGKTTLLQIVGTLSCPDAGRVEIDGQDAFSLGDKALSRFRNERIGFVFQFHHLLPEFTAFENVCIPGFIGRRPRAEVERRAAELLEMMNLTPRRGHKPGQLSGGEQQRVAIARALVNSPAVLLADEPSGNLDSHNRDEIHRLFFELRDRLGQTVVIVTHDEHLAAMADRKITMSDGRIL